MGGLITTGQLKLRPGFEGIESDQAQALIDDASALVRDAALGELDDVESPDTPAAVVVVVVSMIRRGLTNPMGHASENLGDYAYSAGTSGGVATVYLTTRERRIVRRAVGVLGARSLQLTTDVPEQPADLLFGTGGTDLEEGISL